MDLVYETHVACCDRQSVHWYKLHQFTSHLALCNAQHMLVCHDLRRCWLLHSSKCPGFAWTTGKMCLRGTHLLLYIDPSSYCKYLWGDQAYVAQYRQITYHYIF